MAAIFVLNPVCFVLIVTLQSQLTAEQERELERAAMQGDDQLMFDQPAAQGAAVDDAMPTAKPRAGSKDGVVVPTPTTQASAARPKPASGLAAYAPPDVEGLSVHRIRWMSAFNKIIAQWNEVSRKMRKREGESDVAGSNCSRLMLIYSLSARNFFTYFRI